MPITSRVGLSCSGIISSDGLDMYFEDTTGTYNASTNTDGYGLPGGITSASISTASITHYYDGLGVTVSFNFTISSNVITAATMTDITGTTYNILADLGSTAFPFTSSNQFNLRDSDYGDTDSFPDLEDGLMTLTYVITGTMTGTAYTYTTSQQFLRINDLCCCLATKRLTVDPTCDCSEDTINDCNRIEFWLKSAIAAINTNSTDNCLDFLDKAQELCDEDCSNC